MTEDEMTDLRQEFAEPRRSHGCSDRMCGADDCPNCHPDNDDKTEDEP